MSALFELGGQFALQGKGVVFVVVSVAAADDELGAAVACPDGHGDGPAESLQERGDAEGDVSGLRLAACVGGDRELDDGLGLLSWGGRHIGLRGRFVVGTDECADLSPSSKVVIAGRSWAREVGVRPTCRVILDREAPVGVRQHGCAGLEGERFGLGSALFGGRLVLDPSDAIYRSSGYSAARFDGQS